MVKALHRAGIEVILDVVYNHSAEGDHRGPMLALPRDSTTRPTTASSPIDQPLQRLHRHRELAQPRAPERAADDHGLAPLLGDRVPRRRLPLRPRLDAHARVSALPRGGAPGSGALAGQADRRAVGRRPGRLPGRRLPASVERVERPLPRHDARLLARRRRTRPRSRRASPARATSTARPAAHRPRRSTSSRPTTASRSPTSSPTTQKHNEANLEENRDGNNDNRSWNCGAEGPTDDPRIRALRARQQRNMLATLLLSQGVPMLVAGDERGRTQGGNNNAWCQDNEVSWLDWDETDAASELARLHAAAARAPQAPRGVQAHALPRRRPRRVGAPGRVVVPPRRQADGPARLARACAHLGVFLNGQETDLVDRRGRADRRRLVHRAS